MRVKHLWPDVWTGTLMKVGDYSSSPGLKGNASGAYSDNFSLMRPSGPKQPQIYTHDFSEFMNNKKRQTVEGLGRQHQGMDRP